MGIDNIKSPNELYNYMNKNIKYGFVDNNGYIYDTSLKTFENDLINKWIYREPKYIIGNKYGICFDQVLLESIWFKNNNYVFKTYFIIFELPYINNYSTHTFLMYEDKGYWYYFENADFKNRGIYKYNNINDIIKYRIRDHIKDNKLKGLKKEEIKYLKVYEYKNIPYNLKFVDYINEIINNGIEYKIK